MLDDSIISNVMLAHEDNNKSIIDDNVLNSISHRNREYEELEKMILFDSVELKFLPN